MRRLAILCLGIILILPSLALGVSVRVHDRLQLEFDLPDQRWVLSREAPDFLVDKAFADLEAELLGQGKNPGRAEIEAAARRRLEANEAFVFNPLSKAHLLIDFSPLRQGEGAPSAQTVNLSARYAGEGLEEEEGYREVKQKSGEFSLAGAAAASRIDASYLRRGEPGVFVGIIGFASPCWFYLYYTDGLSDPRDLPEMEGILRSMRISADGAK
ncbi:hypothetical protein DSOUD_1756 [Desulfuromonas soudanensis]|uniref:Uncharacterized protein n=1 Tax=Desulfuromonas soudanensis TaxID=1603606 RepID=A0A0M4D1A4_9BACT|nr:hypothetical protein [Desulfuromonas soudanensis]ALC16534.1 hypothetical protein DSOUD_1756 [Desulfuromonas soudanensis]